MKSVKLRDDDKDVLKRNPILFDARGMRVKAGLLSKKWVRVLLFYVLPYVVINGIIFLLVCSRPRVNIDVLGTNNYISADVEFQVNSFLPLRVLNVTLESEPVEYVKSGNTYSLSITQNGTFMVEATSINGMQVREFVNIGLLDETAPNLDESSTEISSGVLSFVIKDNQAGVDYDSIYAVTDAGENLVPSEVDKTLGAISIETPIGISSLDLYYADMVGNEGSRHISLLAE